MKGKSGCANLDFMDKDTRFFTSVSAGILILSPGYFFLQSLWVVGIVCLPLLAIALYKWSYFVSIRKKFKWYVAYIFIFSVIFSSLALGAAYSDDSDNLVILWVLVGAAMAFVEEHLSKKTFPVNEDST